MVTDNKFFGCKSELFFSYRNRGEGEGLAATKAGFYYTRKIFGTATEKRQYLHGSNSKV